MKRMDSRIILIAISLVGFVSGARAEAHSPKISACLRHSAMSCEQEKVVEKIRCLREQKQALQGCREVLQGSLDAKRNELVQEIKAKGERLSEPLKAELVDRSRALAYFSRVNEAYKASFDALIGEYRQMMVMYVRDYQGKEAMINQTLVELKESLGATEVSTLIQASSKLKDLSANEAHLGLQFELAANLFLDKLAGLNRDYHAAYESVRPFLNEAEASGLSQAFSDVEQSLGQVKSYAIVRRGKVKSLVDQISPGIELRIDQVIRIAAAKEAAPTLAVANHLYATAAFMRQVNLVIGAAFVTDYKGPALDLDYYAPKLEALQRYDRLNEQCRHAESWMRSGCLRVRQYETPATNLRADTLPTAIQFGLMMLSTQMTISENTIDAINADLIAGKLMAAAEAHDLLLSQAGGQP